MQEDYILTGDDKRVIDVRLKEHPDANRYDSFHILRRKWERKATQKGREDAVDAGWFVAAKWYRLLPPRMGKIGPGKRLKLPAKGRAHRPAKEQLPAAASPQEGSPVLTDKEPPILAPPPVPSSSPQPKGQVSLLARVEWVFEHLGVEDLKQEDAPTPGTWNMLQAYKDDPTDFYDTFVKSMLPSKAALELETQRYDRGEVPLQFIERCKDKFKEVMSESVPSQN